MCHSKKGSLTIEAALVIPGLLAIILLFCGILRAYLFYNCVSEAMYQTADFAVKYSVIFHKYGLNKLENNVLEALDFDINLVGFLRYGDDIIYKDLFENIFFSNLKKNDLYI